MREIIVKEREIFFYPESFSPGFPENQIYVKSEFGYNPLLSPEWRCPTL